MQDKPVLGMSSCLSGDKVRYNGGDCRDSWLMDELSKWVTWQKFCPEVSMGLPIPRPPMRLKEIDGHMQLEVIENEEKLTELAEKTSRSLVQSLPELDGYILKSRSPSCGLERVKVYNDKNFPERKGIGFFAAELLQQRPWLPMIEEGRLLDANYRELFILKVFAHQRFRFLPLKISALQDFHKKYKFLLLAFNEAEYRKLGLIAANNEKKEVEECFSEYRALFFNALAKPAQRGRQTNALMHVYGYVKKEIDQNEKENFLARLEEFQQGLLPFIAMQTLLASLIKRFSVDYIEESFFFEPYPRKLRLLPQRPG